MNSPEDLIGRARELGRDLFAGRAAAYDRDGQFPVENYADLRAAGLLALCIPTRYGGLGADYATYCQVGREIGRWCPATALTFNMHSCSMLWSSQVCDQLPLSAAERALHETRRAGIYRLVIEEAALFAQPFSEPNHEVAAGRAPFGTTARKVDGGWRLNGSKHFASLAGHATHYGILCTEDRPDGQLSARDTAYLAVAADSPGFAVAGDWDTLGMRATSSRSLVLQEVFVADDLAVMPHGSYFLAATEWPHMFMTLCPSYLGLAEAAFDFTVRYLRGEVEGGPPATRQNPSKQLAVAQLRIKLEQARALFDRAVAEAGFSPSPDARARALA